MKHYNPKIAKDAAAILKPKGENIEAEVDDMVVPTFSVWPLPSDIRTGVLFNATTATAYTCPTDRDTWVTGWALNFIKDATSTATEFGIKVTVDGRTTWLARLGSLSLTAHNGQLSLWLAQPLKIDRGTIIEVSSDTAVANIAVKASVYIATDG